MTTSTMTSTDETTNQHRHQEANEAHTGGDSNSDHQKSVLILLNPHSGRGRSMKIFKKQVEQILSAHHVTHDVFVTANEVRVKDYLNAKSLDQLSKYRALIVVSGDGLLYETVNALMTRDDWQQAIQLPIGLIPTGSGNGLAHTLIKLSHATIKTHADAVKVCSEQAIRGQVTHSDLVKITYGSDGKITTLWSFLSIGWGLLADIDIDSEWLRCLGEFRFSIYGVLKAIKAGAHRGRLSYVLAPSDHSQALDAKLVNESNAEASMYGSDQHKEGPADSIQQEWIHIEDNFTCLYAVHQPYVNSNTNFSPQSTLTDQLTYLTYIRGRLNVCQALKFLLSIEDGSHAKLPYVRVVPVKQFKFQPLERSKIVVDGEIIQWDLSKGPLNAEVVPQMLKLAWSLP